MVNGRVIFLIVLVFAGGWAVGSDAISVGINEDAVPEVPNVGDDGGVTSTATASRDTTDDGGSKEGIDEANVAYLVHQEINERRQAEGLSRLNYDQDLIDVADDYAQTMADTGHYGHTGPDGSTLQDRYQAHGYNCRVDTSGNQYTTGAENILYTYYRTRLDLDERGSAYYSTEQELANGIVNAWMNSSGHRDNIMKPYWKNEGIGIAATEKDGRTIVYAVQNFC